MQQKEIFLEMSNKRISVEVSEEENTNILAEIKRKVFEKENIPEKQQNIYVGDVLLTERHKNTFVRAQLEKQKYGANLKVLTPEQVALCEAIKAVGLPPTRVEIKNDDESLSVESLEGEYGGALSKALDELSIQYTGGRNWLYIDPVNINSVKVLSDDFAKKLKASYEKELANIKNSFFYVSNIHGLGGSIFGMACGVVLAVGAFLFASVASGGVVAVVSAVVSAVAAVVFLGGALFLAYKSIKIGGGGGSPESLTDDSKEKIVPTKESKKGINLDASFKKGDVLQQQSTQLPRNPAAQAQTPEGQEETDPNKPSSTLGLGKKVDD